MSDPVNENMITITNESANLVRVREFVTARVKTSQVKQKDENKIILAVDEAVSNIIEHAYEENREGTIEVEINSDDQCWEVLIRDSGKQFNPEAVMPVDIQEHVKTGKRHGLGIFIMRQIMDEVEYRYKAGYENELRLVKYLKGKPQ